MEHNNDHWVWRKPKRGLTGNGTNSHTNDKWQMKGKAKHSEVFATPLKHR